MPIVQSKLPMLSQMRIKYRASVKNAALFLAISSVLLATEARAVIPKNDVSPIGPYTPGVLAGDYLYVSGQDAKKPDGQMPESFENQVRQTLENVKTVLEAGGLTMQNVVYTQVYLEDMTRFEAKSMLSQFAMRPKRSQCQ